MPRDSRIPPADIRWLKKYAQNPATALTAPDDLNWEDEAAIADWITGIDAKTYRKLKSADRVYRQNVDARLVTRERQIMNLRISPLFREAIERADEPDAWDAFIAAVPEQYRKFFVDLGASLPPGSRPWNVVVHLVAHAEHMLTKTPTSASPVLQGGVSEE